MNDKFEGQHLFKSLFLSDVDILFMKSLKLVIKCPKYRTLAQIIIPPLLLDTSKSYLQLATPKQEDGAESRSPLSFHRSSLQLVLNCINAR